MKIKNNRKNVLITVLGVMSILIAVVGVTYAFFTIQLDFTPGSSINVELAELGDVTFIDGNEINLEGGYPGDILTKTFTVSRDIGEIDQEYKVMMYVDNNDLTEFSNNQFTYSLIGVTNGNGTPSNVNDAIVPIITSQLGSNAVLKGGEIHTYTFSIGLKESGSDQRSTMGKGFNGYLEVEIAVSNYYVTNLVKNGGFDENLDFWNSENGANNTRIASDGVSGGYVRINSTGINSGIISEEIDIPQNHIYYIATKYKKSGGGNLKIKSYGNNTEGISASASTDTNAWTLLSAYGTNTNSFYKYNIIIGSGNSHVQDMIIDVDNVIVVDLTSTFGVGEEPTKEWCDQNITFFEGTKGFLFTSLVPLIVDLDGGNTTQNFEDEYLIGETISLITPTKNGYIFDGWNIEGYNAKLHNNNLRIGIEETKLTAMWISIIKEFPYIGNYATYIIPWSGWYEIEAWGAQGGATTSVAGGKGGYTSGKIHLNKNDILYIYVGGAGKTVTSGTTYYAEGGYNGGGYGGSYSSNYSMGGGGATDIRLTPGNWYDETGLNSRIMVAGAGGATTTNSTAIPGYSGGLIGKFGVASSGTYTTSSYYANGGTQISGGVNAYDSSKNGLYGKALQSPSAGWGGGGGGGYYGGAQGAGVGGGGGSSFISGYAGVTAIDEGSISEPRAHTNNNTKHYSGKYFVDGVMIPGNQSMPSPDGGTETGHNGDGYARITYLGSEAPTRINTKLNNVRYIKDCGTSDNINSVMYWTEIQAIKDGENLAYGKNVSPTTATYNSNVSYTTIVDGLVNATYVHTANTAGTKCVTIDLQDSYNLDEIMVLHLPTEICPSNQPFKNNITYVSSDDTNWIEVMNTGNVTEYWIGKRVNAYNNDVTY